MKNSDKREAILKQMKETLRKTKSMTREELIASFKRIMEAPEMQELSAMLKEAERRGLEIPLPPEFKEFSALMDIAKKEERQEWNERN